MPSCHINHLTETIGVRSLPLLAGIPVEGKSSECLICMKYRIIILIIIIISLGQIFYRILHTHHACTCAYTHARTSVRTHVRTHVHTHSRRRRHRPPHMLSLFGVAQPWRSAPLATMPNSGYSNNHTHWRPDYPDMLDVFRI